jgi:hypothetical protein
MKYLFDQNIVMSAFTGLPFEIRGIGIFVEQDGANIVCIRRDGGKYEQIGIDDNCNNGYVRTTGVLTAVGTPVKISCTQQYQRMQVPLVIVIGLVAKQMDQVREAVMYRASLIEGMSFISATENKQQILTEENMRPNQLDMLKFNYTYTFDYVPRGCDIDLTCDC